MVCNLDTGVRYEHPAIASRWRANQPGVDPSEAWFDALGGRPLPYDNDILSPTHGSHTMGTMTGLDEANADTIGVAFGASWIAAKVFNKYGMGNLTWLIKAFQWAVDPDDNPLTVDDVPTVISNSWGFTSPPCDDALWSVMDACEAMGAAIVFAVGNESALGPRTPQDRITTDVNVFSTGATDANENIASFSSLGPSKCDNITIKPEVSAPGVDVRSIRRTGYGTMSGTSMACPHVAGALALLRQVDPDASVDQIKTALYLSARDKGAPGEDNTFGMGIIDLPAAALLLGETPSVEIEVTGPSEVVAGVPVDVTTIVTNLLAQANTLELWATLTGAIGDYSHPLAHWTVTLAPNSTIETTTEATAPLDLPGGDYVLEVKAGSFPFARSSGGAEFTLSH